MPAPDSLALNRVERAGLLHRADVRRTLAEYEAADARYRLELANQYPNITLTPSYTFQEGFPAYVLGAAVECCPCFIVTKDLSPKRSRRGARWRPASMRCRHRLLPRPRLLCGNSGRYFPPSGLGE